MGRKGAVLAAALFLSVGPLAADTIYQTDPEEVPVVIQSDAILVSQDSSTVIYKHFDLKERRIVMVHLPQESHPYSVVTSSPAARQRIVALWKEFGYTAEVKDAQGNVTRVFDAYLDFFPPAGGFFIHAVPATTAISIQLDGGGVDTLAFSRISRIEIDGERLKVRLDGGRTEQGKILLPTQEPAVADFMGLTSHYDPSSKEVFDFSVPLARIKQIVFVNH